MVLLIFLFVVFGFLFFISYTVTYNHNFIPTYITSSKIPKISINQHINQLSSKYNMSLLDLTITDDEINIGRPKASSTSASFHGFGHGRSNSFGASILHLIEAQDEAIVRSLFSLGVSLSVMLIILILCELMDFFDGDERLFGFHLVINLLIGLLTVLQPFVMLSLWMFESLYPKTSEAALLSTNSLTSYLKRNLSLVVFVATYMFWFFCLHKLGSVTLSYLPTAPGIRIDEEKSYIERKINEISIAGISVMAILSGVGCMSTPYRQFPELYNKYKRQVVPKKIITQLDLNNLIQSYNNTESLIAKRSQQLQNVLGGSVYTSGDSYQANGNLLQSYGKPYTLKLGGIMNKVQSFASLSSLRRPNSEESELCAEIDALKSLKNHMYDDLLSMIEKFQFQHHDEGRGMVLAKLLRWFDWGFGVYCVYRIVNVLAIKLPYQALHSEAPQVGDLDLDTDDVSATNDALAITIAKVVLSITSLQLTETQLVYQISFLLSGGLFIGSISNVVTTLRSFRKFLPSLGNHSASTLTFLKHLVISELLGIYVMSTALLIRTNLPENLSAQVSKVLSLSGSAITKLSKKSRHWATKEVEFIDNWFDRIFAITCIITLIVLLLKRYVDDDNSMDEYDEENMIETGKIA